MTKISESYSVQAVGIDFGTTNSLLCIYEDTFKFIDFQNDIMLHSVVAYEDSKKFFGKDAINKNSIRSIKRLISNSEEQIDSSLEYKLENGVPYLFVDKGWKSVIDISSDILKYIRHMTNLQLQENIRNAVICVPARFDERQRQWILEAAVTAGWRILRIIAEPTAAILSEKLHDGIYGVYDLGGGTFDFSIVRQESDITQVLGTTGDMSIGGDYFDEIMYEYYKFQIPLSDIRSVREGKMTDFDIDIQQFNNDLHEQCAFLVERSINLCKELIKRCKVDLEEIIIVGGGSQMKIIVDALKNMGIPIRIPSNPQLCVAKGAAIYANKIQNHSNFQLLLDVTPLSLGIESLHGMVEWVIPKNSPLPCSKTVVFTNADKNQTSIIFNLVQGDGALVDTCRSLGKFSIKIQKSIPNTARVEVNFTINTDGMLLIKAKNLNSGESYDIAFNSGEGLTKSMVDRMIKQSSDNVFDQENSRRLYKMLNEIEIVLRGLKHHDLSDFLNKRKQISDLDAAEDLMDQIEKKFGEKIHNNLHKAIQKLYDES
jgi:molecular chaperone HscA